MYGYQEGLTDQLHSLILAGEARDTTVKVALIAKRLQRSQMI